MPEVSIPRSYGHVTHDTIFDQDMRSVFTNEPSEVLRRIRFGIPANWAKVLIGETGEMVSIAEYIHGDKHKAVVKTLNEFLSKRGKKIYENDPELFQRVVEQTAQKLFGIIKD